MPAVAFRALPTGTVAAISSGTLVTCGGGRSGRPAALRNLQTVWVACGVVTTVAMPLVPVVLRLWTRLRIPD